MLKGNMKYLSKLILLVFFSVIINSLYAADIKKNLGNAFEAMCKQQQFSGAVLIAIDGKIIFKEACGLASREFNVANTVNTKFNLGSVGKLFTSVAIAQLVQEKKISLSTPVVKLIPDWLPKLKNSQLITVEELLLHDSGLGTYMDDERWKLGSDSGLYVNVNDYKPLIQADKLLFKPGENQSYSNNGYLLLGAIVEAVSHAAYSQYLENSVFRPAGMKNTNLWALDEVIPNRAVGYFEKCHKGVCTLKNNNYEAPFIGSPAGGAYSTLDDLFQFSQYLHQSKVAGEGVLSTDIVSVSKDAKLKSYPIGDMRIPENFSPYGFAGAWNKYGFAVWEDPLLLGHTGGIEGASAFFATSPDNKYTIIILSNRSGSGALKWYLRVREILGLSPKIINY